MERVALHAEDEVALGVRTWSRSTGASASMKVRPPSEPSSCSTPGFATGVRSPMLQSSPSVQAHFQPEQSGSSSDVTQLHVRTTESERRQNSATSIQRDLSQCPRAAPDVEGRTKIAV